MTLLILWNFSTFFGVDVHESLWPLCLFYPVIKYLPIFAWQTKFRQEKGKDYLLNTGESHRLKKEKAVCMDSIAVLTCFLHLEMCNSLLGSKISLSKGEWEDVWMQMHFPIHCLCSHCGLESRITRMSKCTECPEWGHPQRSMQLIGFYQSSFAH